MISLVKFVSKELDLHIYSEKDKTIILKLMFAFFLGHHTYNRTSYTLCKHYGKKLEDGGMQRKFSNLTSKVGVEEVDYIMTNLRGRLNNRGFKVFKTDWLFLNDHLDFDVQYSPYPTEEKVLKDINPFIRNLSYKFKLFTRTDFSRDVEDIMSDLMMYSSGAYRKYIYDYCKTPFDKDNYKLLLSLIYKTTRNGGIDYIQSFYKNKRVVCLKTSSIEDFNTNGDLCLKQVGDETYADIRKLKFNDD
jgi:hypothetical protein